MTVAATSRSRASDPASPPAPPASILEACGRSWDDCPPGPAASACIGCESGRSIPERAAYQPNQASSPRPAAIGRTSRRRARFICEPDYWTVHCAQASVRVTRFAPTVHRFELAPLPPQPAVVASLKFEPQPGAPVEQITKALASQRVKPPQLQSGGGAQVALVLVWSVIVTEQPPVPIDTLGLALHLQSCCGSAAVTGETGVAGRAPMMTRPATDARPIPTAAFQTTFTGSLQFRIYHLERSRPPG